MRHRTYHNLCRVFFFLGKDGSLCSNFTRITWFAIIHFLCTPDITPGIVCHPDGQCLIARQVVGYSGHEWPGKIAFHLAGSQVGQWGVGQQLLPHPPNPIRPSSLEVCILPSHLGLKGGHRSSKTQVLLWRRPLIQRSSVFS